MKILYADDAGNTGTDYDNPQQPLFSLLGIAVDSNKWHESNNLFEKEKTKIFSEFENSEIHASDIFNKKKYGNVNFRKYDNYYNLEVLEQIVNLILALDINIIHFSVRKENLKNYCAYKFKSQIKIDPYLIAFSYLSRYFNDYVKSLSTKGLIILDEQRGLTDNIGQILKTFQICDETEAIKVDSIIETSLFLESKKSNFIQIADICNFYFNRDATNVLLHKNCETTPNKHVTNMYEKLRTKVSEYDPMAYPEMLNFIAKNFSL